MRYLFIIVASVAMALSLSGAGLPESRGVIAAERPTMSDSIPPIVFPGVEKAVVGLYIEDIATGEAVAEYGADRPLCPASIMKSVTVASVMSLYPADQCFATRFYARGEVADSVLYGDVVVEASGDPTLGSAYFDNPDASRDSLVAALRNCGIDSITGSIVVDQSAVPDPSYPLGWGDDDYMWPYGAMLRGLNWRDNRYTLSLPSKNTDPYIPGLTVDFRKLRRGKMGYDAMPPLTTIKAWGKPPRKGASVLLAMPDPAESFIYAMTAALVDSGIRIGGDKAVEEGPVTELAVVTSPAFPNIMRSLMHRSDNLMAEGMMRTIAPRQPRDTAAVRELSLWALRGADTDSVNIIDGSGLSRLNRITPWFLADVLAWMARSPNAAEYAALFPRVGREGTVKRLLAGTRLEGRLALKTGTMSGVRSLAGYLLDEEGMPVYSVVLIVNGFTCPSSKINQAAETFFLNFFS